MMGENRQQLNISFSIYDDSGRSIGADSVLVMIHESPRSPGGRTETLENEIAVQTESVEFAKLMLAGTASRNEGGFMQILDLPDGVMLSNWQIDQSMVTPAWRGKLLAPDRFEPMALLCSDALVDLARAKKSNIVANLPDGALDDLAKELSAGKFRPSEFLTHLASMGVIAKEDDGWITIRPRFLSETYRSRIDRQALGELLRSASQAGLADLEPLAKYAAAQPLLAGYLKFEQRYLSLVCPNLPYGLANGVTRNMLRLYHSLSHSQRRKLEKGEPVAMSALGSSQKAIVSSLLYDSFGGPRVQIEAADSGRSKQPMGSYRSESLAEERTEAMPNGLSNDGEIRLNQRRLPAVIAYRREDSVGRIFSAREFGSYLGARASDKMGPQMAGQPSFERFRPAEISHLDFEFLIGPGIVMAQRLDKTSFSGGGLVYFDQLSEQFRGEVDRASRQMTRLLDAKPSSLLGPGASKPAPPPPSRRQVS